MPTVGRIEQLSGAGVIPHDRATSRPYCEKCGERMFCTPNPFTWTCSHCGYSTPCLRDEQPAANPVADRFAQRAATLVFPLPDYEHDYYCAQNGFKYRAALEELDGWLRDAIKYGGNTTVEQEAYESARDKLLRLVNEQGVKLHEE